MTNKDIKNRLNNEMEDITPNVLPNVKSEPINPLLNGENPVQAFKKRLTTWLLVFTLLIFAVMTVSIVAFYSVPHTITQTPTYISVSLTRGENVQVFGVIADDKGIITEAVNLGNGEEINAVIGKQRVELLPLLTQYEDGDKVYVSFHNDVTEVAAGTCDAVVTALNAFSGTYVSLEYAVGDSHDKMRLVEYINAKEIDDCHADLGMKIEDLCRLLQLVSDYE